MLERLDSVAWRELTHAYGPAKNVPAQIRALRSADPKTREQALWKLYGNIFHQGTRYQATPHAIPFLYELVSAPDTPNREDIVYLLVNLALGYEEAYLPEGFDPVVFARQVEDAESRMSASDRAQCSKYGFGPRVDLDCYREVEEGVPLLMGLLDDTDRRVRKAAVYSLAWFSSHAADALPRMRWALEAETEDAGIANAVLAIGLLSRVTRDESQLARVRPMLTHPSLLIRTAAAIALACEPLEEPVLTVLIDAISSSDGLQGVDIHFNEGNLAGYASLVLARGGADARARIVPALCATLRGIGPWQALDVTRALLDLTVAGRTTSVKDVPASSLDAVELDALRAIAEHGGWRVDGATFVNYCQLVHSYGLPDSQEALLNYLATR